MGLKIDEFHIHQCLMDVITTYLYGSIDNDIYMKFPEGFILYEANNTKPRSMC